MSKQAPTPKRFSPKHVTDLNDEDLRIEEMLEVATGTPTVQPVLEGYLNKSLDRIQFKNPSFIALRKYAEAHPKIEKGLFYVDNLVLRYDDTDPFGQPTRNQITLKFRFFINPYKDNIRNVSLGLDYLKAGGHTIKTKVVASGSSSSKSNVSVAPILSLVQ